MTSHVQRRWANVLLYGATSILLLAYGSGCQQYAKITWDTPKQISAHKKIQLAVGDLAELRRKGDLYDPHPSSEVIGKHTFSVFAIPAGSINTHTTTPLKGSFDRAVRDALEAAGYELIPASRAPADAPVLRGEVNKCWWHSYTWLWPFVIQGGENKVTLRLETQQGQQLWKRTFSRIEPGFVVGGAYAFDLMIKWSMTKLLRDIAKGCSSDVFRIALKEGVQTERLL